MTAVSAGLALASTLAAGTLWWMQRRAQKNDDPLEQNKKRYETIDKDLTKRDSMAATEHATDDLDTLERLQNHEGDKR